MQFAGQICGQSPHATHLARPCSSVSMRWVPRQREESVQSFEDFSSGYCIDFGAQEMAERQRHALEGGPQVRRLLGRPLQHFHADGHYAASCGTDPETMRPRSSHHTSGIRSTRLRPPRAQAMRGPYSQPSWILVNQLAAAKIAI